MAKLPALIVAAFVAAVAFILPAPVAAQAFVPPAGGKIGGVVIRKAPGALTSTSKVFLRYGSPWTALLGAGIQAYSLYVADENGNPWPWAVRSRNAPPGTTTAGTSLVPMETYTETAVPGYKTSVGSPVFESASSACTSLGGWNGNYTACVTCDSRWFSAGGHQCGSCICVNAGGSGQFNAVQRWPSTGLEAPGGYTVPFSTRQSQRCPVGSVQEGSMCRIGTLTDDGYPALSPDDVSGWNVEVAPADPDVAPQAWPATVTQPLEYESTDAEGQRVRVRIEPLPDGSVRVTTSREGMTGNQKTTETKRMVCGPTGICTAEAEMVTTGGIEDVPQTPPPAGTVVNPLDIQIPTDYAREPTLQATREATEALKADADAAKSAGQGYTPPDMAGVNDPALIELPTAETYTPWELPALPFPGSSGGCAPYVITLQGRQFSLNPCPILVAVRPIIDWGFIFLCVIGSVFAVLGRREEVA